MQICTLRRIYLLFQLIDYNLNQNDLKKIYLFISLCMLCSNMIAQVTLKGKVQDAFTGDPLIGANIVVQGTTDGNVTDYDGFFELTTSQQPPLTLVVSYLGYNEKEILVSSADPALSIRLEESSVTVDVVEVKASRVSDEVKKSPLTVEALDAIAIKETPAADFYSGLGSLKGVDLTTASLGFTVINTRGFNSTSPVRSLQTIDGVDNQSPGLNFSLGNFLGSSELDVNKVDLVVGASSAFYGPNAFNGVIAMETKNPFFHKGLAASVKVAEREQLKGEIRWAQDFKNKNGDSWFAYKLNASHMRAFDWVADNFDPITAIDTNFISFSGENGSERQAIFVPADNPGRTDGVNIYGDESFANFSNLTGSSAGLNTVHRTGYAEADLVDYDTRNTKLGAAFHFRTNPSQGFESPELIFSSGFGSGTTVYQGDNRFSLRGIRFYQNRIEFRKKDKWFIRAYATNENAGDSYDPYFTALKLQEFSNNDFNWQNNYATWWQQSTLGNVANRMQQAGYPANGTPEEQILWQQNNRDSLTVWHQQAAAYADSGEGSNADNPLPQPGTAAFDSLFQAITTAKNNEEENGTRFSDRSALYHIHGEYIIPVDGLKDFRVGGNGRLYRPNTEGTIFDDELEAISNYEFGFYSGASKEIDNLTLSAAVRVDKNQNFDALVSPAGSVVWNPAENTFLRASYSSAIRNPTLSDQYLNLNVGPARLLGNLSGYDSLYTLQSFIDNNANPNLPLDTISIAAIKPEQVQTMELGFRTALGGSLFLDGSYYYNIYKDFIGFQLVADIPFVLTELFPGGPLQVQPDRLNAEVQRISANSDSTVTTQGLAIGFNYYISNYSIAGNYSWNRLITDSVDNIVPAFNTPEHKFNISVGGRDLDWLGKQYPLGFNINYKWIEGFVFEGSPQFTGDIPTYDMVDAQVNIGFKKYHTTLKIGASNLLNNKQFQTYGGPRIGRLAYIGLTYDFKEKI